MRLVFLPLVFTWTTKSCDRIYATPHYLTYVSTRIHTEHEHTDAQRFKSYTNARHYYVISDKQLSNYRCSTENEIMRGGINSVDKGQLEAGRALGMTYSTTMLKIVVPQAVKNILPTLGNEFISLIKETSVLSFIAVYDLYKALLDVGMVKYDSMVPYIMMGVIYIILVLIISLGIKVIERRFAKSDRN